MIKFQKNFIFGIAESDLQTVGSQEPYMQENAHLTMWDEYSKKNKKDLPDRGGLKYNYFKQDADLISNLGVNSYRTSISMSRTIDRHGKINKKALKWYRNYLTKLKKRGVDIHLCLYHWEAPKKFTNKGILHPDFINVFLKHVDISLDYLSDLVDYYIPMNELWCICYLSYYVGIHAPGINNLKSFFRAYFQSMHLQNETIKKIRSFQPSAKIGVVNIHFPTYIRVINAKFMKARAIADDLTNFIYSDPLFFGDIPQKIIYKFKTNFPKNYKTILSESKLADAINYYGINYYNGQFVKPSNKAIGFELDEDYISIKNSLGWPVFIPPRLPSGLTDIIQTYYQRYNRNGLKKLFISENGTPAYSHCTDGQIPQDNERILYIHEHLKQIEKAIAKGCTVNGYFLWTLLDNYEWQSGYSPESAFGLVQVDPKTGSRIPKKSYYWYQQLIHSYKQ
ncbi:family 1 glycosylhydrolase [Candidatus Woesebacteria bacterium]|nr:family 1 glycosylhydrolase [Candidatus Woesebacteria bacterium]